MNMMFIMGGLFFFVIVAFVAGMFLMPELFGISKPESSEKKPSDDEDRKSQ